MKVLSTFVFALLYYSGLFAQNNTSITVKAGTSIKESVSTTDLYEYPQFVYGNVIFRDGTSSGATMNYNRFLDEMQFINRKGDTLAIANEKTIHFIIIDKDSFFYDQGYIRLLKGNNAAKLAVKQRLKVADKLKMSGYGMTSSTSAIDNYDSYNEGIKLYNISVLEDIVLSKEMQYYFGDKYNHFVLASKRNLLELFSKQQGAVKNYLKENVVDFNSKDDLERLVQFLEHM